MKTVRLHFVDYLSIGLLMSLLFFTAFSSNYLNSKKTINIKAECPCGGTTVEDPSVCTDERDVIVSYGEKQDCTSDEEGNESCTSVIDYDNPIYDKQCFAFGTKEECNTECPATTGTPVDPEVPPVVVPPVDPVCVPDCVGKCGDVSDGCGGTCNTICAGPSCTASCTGKCGGELSTCDTPCPNTCSDGQVCNAGICSAGTAPTSSCSTNNGTCMANGCTADYTIVKDGTCPDTTQTCCFSKATLKSQISAKATPGTPQSTIDSAFNSALSNLTNTLLNNLFKSTTGTTGTNPTAIPTSYLSPTPSVTPTPTPAGKVVSLNMKLRFQGIAKKPVSTSSTMDVKVTLYNTLATTAARRSVTASGTFAYSDSGIWTGTVTFLSAYPGDGYYILVKGPKQLQRKICTTTATDAQTLGAECSGTLTLLEGTNTIDMTGVTLLAGDVNQDGVINASDLGFIKLRLGKLDASSLQMADLNFDGVVNSLDYSLIIQAWPLNDADQQ